MVAGGVNNLSAGDSASLWSENKRLSQSCLPSLRCQGVTALEIAAEQVTTKVHVVFFHTNDAM